MNEQLPHTLTLTCSECSHQIDVSLADLNVLPLIIHCSRCHKQYGFHDNALIGQVRQFISLCKEIKASEKLLASASVAVNIGNNEVKIPFKLLLTRLRSTFDLAIGNKKMTFSYRTEPTKIAEALEKNTFESTL